MNEKFVWEIFVTRKLMSLIKTISKILLFDKFVMAMKKI